MKYVLVVEYILGSEAPECICNRYTMVCLSVHGDKPQALASGLFYVRVDSHDKTILYHLHQCRPCTYPGVASSIPVRSHTFVEIDHEIISTVILLLPLIYSRRVVVSYKRKYVHELLVNRLFKPAQEKVWLGELTVPQ